MYKIISSLSLIKEKIFFTDKNINCLRLNKYKIKIS